MLAAHGGAWRRMAAHGGAWRRIKILMNAENIHLTVCITLHLFW
jgi:hypothetical protein